MTLAHAVEVHLVFGRIYSLDCSLGALYSPKQNDFPESITVPNHPIITCCMYATNRLVEPTLDSILFILSTS